MDDGLLPLLATHTARLLDSARGLDDPRAPSLCTGWSRGHVLTHLARNADGMCALVRAAVDGTGETMYRSMQGRDDDIEAGAGRPRAELVADLEATAAALAEAFARLRPEHAAAELERTPGQRFGVAGSLPFLRLREVVYHHVDLDAGFGFEDVEPALVDRFLADEDARLGEDAPRARAGDLLWRARGIRTEVGR